MSNSQIADKEALAEQCEKDAAAIRALRAQLETERNKSLIREANCILNHDMPCKGLQDERKTREEERHALIVEARKWQERAEAAEQSRRDAVRKCVKFCNDWEYAENVEDRIRDAFPDCFTEPETPPIQR